MDPATPVRASRMRLAPSRGALSGILLLVLGAWAALVPFFGPTLNLAYTPAPNDTWHWTAARGWLEVLPGAVAFVGGVLLLMSTSRIVTIIGAWFGVAGGAWLVVGAPLAGVIHLNAGTPDPSLGTDNRAVTALLFFYGIGAAIVFVGSLALGRVSVQSLRDVRAAERRVAAAEAAAAAEHEANARREAEIRAQVEREFAQREAARRESTTAQRSATHWPPAGPQAEPTGARHAAETPAQPPYGATTGPDQQPDGRVFRSDHPATPAYGTEYAQRPGPTGE
jgi:Tfp pilus assembly protein PilV